MRQSVHATSATDPGGLVLELDYAVPDKPDGLVSIPSVESAGELVRENEKRHRRWDFLVAGLPGEAFAATARASSLEAARYFCRQKGIVFRERPGPLVVTGHQPFLFHPGVWVKNFLADLLAETVGGTGLNLVVDTDAAGDMTLDVPVWDGSQLAVVRRPIVPGAGMETPFESIDPPDAAHVEEACRATAADLETLPDPAASSAFAAFCGALRDVLPASRSLGELMTSARRRYEEPTSVSYLELPISAQSQTDAFLLFFLSIAEHIEQFRNVYNRCLDGYRDRYEVRSSANPFPDLATEADLVETPFWLMDAAGLRATLWLKRKGDLSLVCHANGCKVELHRGRFEENIARLRDQGIQIRPKALVLTLFNRMFVADLFVHGIGGAKYDRVTDEIIRGFYGVEPPLYMAATATLWLPMGVSAGSGESVADLRQRLHALEHNPDRFSDDAAVSDGERARVAELADEKARLVEAIAKDGADKKAIGARIREVNAAISALLEPLRRQTQEEIAAVERSEASRGVAEHREFPFCYWPPGTVRELVTRALKAVNVRQG